MKFEGKREKKYRVIEVKQEKIPSNEFFISHIVNFIILYSCKKKRSFPKEKERVLHLHPVI